MTGAPPIVLEARGVGRVLPGIVPVRLLNGVDLTFRAGEFVAVTGPSGSGKSSLLYLLGLLDRPTEGSVWLDGADTSGLGAGALAHLRLARLGFIFQFHFLLPEFTALENVMVPMRRLTGSDAASVRDRAADLLERLGLGAAQHKRPEQLSGGERQRVAVARALANNPPVLLADEPTGNLDSGNARNVFDIFGRLAREEGRVVLVVTHDRDLAALTDRRVEMLDGRIASDGGANA